MLLGWRVAGDRRKKIVQVGMGRWRTRRIVKCSRYRHAAAWPRWWKKIQRGDGAHAEIAADVKSRRRQIVPARQMIGDGCGFVQIAVNCNWNPSDESVGIVTVLIREFVEKTVVCVSAPQRVLRICGRLCISHRELQKAELPELVAVRQQLRVERSDGRVNVTWGSGPQLEARRAFQPESLKADDSESG